MFSKHKREHLYNKLILRCPAQIQILFMERVMKGVKASLREEEAGKVLQSEKEGSLRARRPNQSSSVVRTTQLDVLGVQEAYQPLPSFSELLRRDRRAYRAACARWNSHVG